MADCERIPSREGVAAFYPRFWIVVALPRLVPSYYTKDYPTSFFCSKAGRGQTVGLHFLVCD